MIIACGLMVFGALVQNRIQRACVDYGNLVTFPESPERPDKLSFATKELEKEQTVETVYKEIYASAGTLGAINIVNYILLAIAIVWVGINRKSKT